MSGHWWHEPNSHHAFILAWISVVLTAVAAVAGIAFFIVSLYFDLEQKPQNELCTNFGKWPPGILLSLFALLFGVFPSRCYSHSVFSAFKYSTRITNKQTKPLIN